MLPEDEVLRDIEARQKGMEEMQFEKLYKYRIFQDFICIIYSLCKA